MTHRFDDSRTRNILVNLDANGIIIIVCYTQIMSRVATRTQIELRSTKRRPRGLSRFLKFPSSILAVTRITNFIRSKICFIQCHVTHRFPTYSHADPII